MLRYQEDAVTGVAEIEISGRVSREEFDRVAEKLEALIAKHDQIRVLEILHDFEGMDVGAFWEDLKFSLRHMQDFSRCAVVSDQKWVDLWTQILSPLIRCEVEYFEPDKMREARAWLERIE